MNFPLTTPVPRRISNIPSYKYNLATYLYFVFVLRIFQTNFYPEAELPRGLQKDGVPLVPPLQFFPQGLQLAQEFLDLGAARVPCTDQPATLLRGQHYTDGAQVMIKSYLCWATQT